MVLFSGGQLYACGCNSANQLGLDSRPGLLRLLSHRVRTVNVAWHLTRVNSVGKARVETMASGSSYGGAVTSGGSLFMFGKNAVGGLGSGDTVEIADGKATEVRSVLDGHTVRALACGETIVVAAADVGPETSAPREVVRRHDSQPRKVGAKKIFAWGRGMVSCCACHANLTRNLPPSCLGEGEGHTAWAVALVCTHLRCTRPHAGLTTGGTDSEAGH
jgi:hypothetical protein